MATVGSSSPRGYSEGSGIPKPTKTKKKRTTQGIKSIIESYSKHNTIPLLKDDFVNQMTGHWGTTAPFFKIPKDVPWPMPIRPRSIIIDDLEASPIFKWKSRAIKRHKSWRTYAE